MTLPDIQLNSTELLSSMTPEQKLGQLFLINLNGIEADQDFIKLEETYHFGNVYLSGQNLRSPEQVQQLNRQLRHLITDASDGILPILAIDEEGGSASQFPFYITRTPGNFTLGAAHNPEITKALGQALGNDLNDLGFNMLLGPVLDLCRSHSDQVIGVRAYSDNPLLAASLGTAFAQGVEAGGCGCTFKHFPGYGDMAMHDGVFCNTSTYDELLHGDVYPFAQAILSGARSIMAGQIVLPNLTSEAPQLPATLSKEIIQHLLREQLNFSGVVIADGAMAPNISNAKGALLAFNAGVDIIKPDSIAICCAMYKSLHTKLMRGKISMDELDRHVMRILCLKQQLALLKKQRQIMSQLEKSSWLKRALRSSVTLLRDQRNLVPLPADKAKALIISPRLEKPGILDDNATDIYTFGDYMSLLFSEAHVRRVSGFFSQAEEQALLDAARKVDIVIIGSEDAHLHPHYLNLINRLSEICPTIAVLLRSPYDAALLHKSVTVIGAFTHTAAAMEAVALVLEGKIPPRGKLPLEA